MWKSALPLWLSAVAACGQDPQNDPPLVDRDGPEIVYRMTSGRTLDVFNVEQSWFARTDIDYLNVSDQAYGEFGGPIVFCSNDKFYCLRGGVRIAVPKAASGQTRWSADGIDCEATSPFRGQRLTATCAFAGANVLFAYSPVDGITWYERSGDEGHRYWLVGRRGLFAEGSPSAQK